jgi:hypothetical protein
MKTQLTRSQPIAEIRANLMRQQLLRVGDRFKRAHGNVVHWNWRHGARDALMLAGHY